MKLPAMAADYRNLKLSKIHQPEYRHILYLLFWPALVLRYILIERFLIPGQYHEEYLFIFGMHLYTCLYDIRAFKWYSKYLLVCFSLSTLTFLLFPTCQNLRPAAFPRNNFLTDIVGLLYALDTNTNVCPSEHVIGSIAAFLAARHTQSLRKPGLTITFSVVAFFTSIATVFLKQHSFVDLLAALHIC